MSTMVMDCPNLIQQMHGFLERDVLCDTTLVTSDRDLMAHSIILAAASPVFEAALQNFSSQTNTFRLEMVGVDGILMESILHLIYTGSLQNVQMLDTLTETCFRLGLDWILSSELAKRSTLQSMSCSTNSGASSNGDNELPSGVDTIKFSDADQMTVMQPNASVGSSASTHSLSQLYGSCLPREKRLTEGCNTKQTKLEVGLVTRQNIVTGLNQRSNWYENQVEQHDHTSRQQNIEVRSFCNGADPIVGVKGDFVCDQCEGSFSDATELISHREKCYLSCLTSGDNGNERSKPFRKLQALNRTRRGRPPEVQHTGARHQCDDCGLRFQFACHLRSHRRRHTGVLPYECPVCGRRFRDNCISKHMLTHTGERSHTCEECGRAFARAGDLLTHRRTLHAGERNHQCTDCGRAFAKRSDLSRHARVHTGERPYVCEECGKAFKVLFHLRLHACVHATMREFTCGTCAKSFTCAARLKRHETVHSSDGPHVCGVCRQTFLRLCNLRAHKKLHGCKRTVLGSDVCNKGVQDIGYCLEEENAKDSGKIICSVVESPEQSEVLSLLTRQRKL